MIDEDTKRKFIKELAKNGNVYVAAMKTGIDRSSHYRWKKEDKDYRKVASQAEKHGRANNCDIAEHALMIKVKEKDINSIKYLLGHNSPRYKPKKRHVIIEHSRLTQAKEEFELEKRKRWDEISDEYKRVGELVRELNLDKDETNEE